MIKTTVKVDGMMCGMCESHVNDAVRKVFQVDKVTSSHLERKKLSGCTEGSKNNLNKKTHHNTDERFPKKKKNIFKAKVP